MKQPAMMVGIIIAVLLILCSPVTLQAQSGGTTTSACPQIVEIALATTHQLCERIGENQACYGHVLVDALPQDHVEEFAFSQEGDIAELVDLKTIRLSPMDLESGLWGVALMNLRAYMQYASPQPVTFLLFGDVEINNRVAPAPTIEVTVASRTAVNVRLAPTPNAGVIGVLQPGQTVTAKARLADNSWLRVALPDNDRVGWTFAANLTSEEDINTLNVVESWAPFYGPMQAFYFRSGIDDAACVESPPSGLLIQTPEGVAEVTLLVNEVSIQMSATAYLQAAPGEQMTFSVLSGWAIVEAAGRQQPVFAGTQVSIPLSADLTPVAPPSAPAPYDLAALQALPLNLLGSPVTIASPLQATQIMQLLEAVAEAGGVISSASVAAAAETSSGSSDTLPPGLEGAAPPGQGGTAPGQGGTPPGQTKK
ncbi:MAG: SH3 domain-containing protein [Anaerolineae bacterium]|nr:SH3 domain-containing protein [Anaerolineae bacterium]